MQGYEQYSRRDLEANTSGNSSGGESSSSSSTQTAKQDCYFSSSIATKAIVDTDVFDQILYLDGCNPEQEFSRGLVWAWCDQAEQTVQEMEVFLHAGRLPQLADKAHFLRGSSASLGLLRVSDTCENLFQLHAPASLALYRRYSYQTDYFRTHPTSYSSYSPASSADSPSSSASPPSTTISSPALSNITSPGPRRPPLSRSLTISPNGVSPDSPTMDFTDSKLDRARELVLQLKDEIQEATEWLYAYYEGSDKLMSLPNC